MGTNFKSTTSPHITEKPHSSVTEHSSIKNIHGICKSKYLYEGKELIVSLALKVFCKTPNESVIESIGSVAELHTKSQRNCNFMNFKTELMLD
jgi:hypothetical protein